MEDHRLFDEVLFDTAATLRRTFFHVGSLNGGRDAPMPERNTVVHLASAFIRRGYSVYAEAALAEAIGETAGRGQLDLIVASEEDVFAIEVKTWGKVNLESVLTDLRRCICYKPAEFRRCTEFEDLAYKWWKNRRHWSAVVIQAFTGEEFLKQWRGLTADSRGKELRKEYSGADMLADELRAHQGRADGVSVCEGLWKDAERLDLLYLFAKARSETECE